MTKTIMCEKYIRHLCIVQSHPTQFDGPLFRFLSKQPDIDLNVFFYGSRRGAKPFDKEIQRNSEWDHDVTSGYKQVYADKGLFNIFRFLYDILGKENRKYIIVSGYASPVVLSIAMIGKLCRIPVGLRSDNILKEFNARSIRGRIKKIVLPILFRLYTTGHPVGTLAEEYLIRFGFKKPQLFRFPYAVDNEYLKKQSERYRGNRENLRDHMGIRKNDVVFLGIMKFSEREDPITLLQSYHKVSEKVDGIHLILVGDGPLRSKISAYIHDNGLKDITMPGYRRYSDLPLFYAISDVFVHTARKGAWEVSIQEAMACGVPVIVADSVGSAYDLVTGKNTGLVFESGNVASLADSMMVMLLDSDLRQKFQDAAKEVIAKWSYQETLMNLREALNFVR